MSTAPERGIAGGWDTFWQTLNPDSRLYEEQSREYVRKLTTEIQIPCDARVLDFGCGFGFAALELAPLVGKLYLWDPHPRMRLHAQRHVAHLPNVCVLANYPAVGRCDVEFDFVLVNSVIQYMQVEEFASWLQRWPAVLAPDGQIIISDIIPHGHKGLFDYLDLLRFSMRRRFLLQAVTGARAEIVRYWMKRHERPLTHHSHQHLRHFAAEADLTLEMLSCNLTHFRSRHSVVLAPVSADQSPHPFVASEVAYRSEHR